MTAAPERTLAIDWDADARQFHLRNDRISYLIRVLENGTLGQLYFGPTLAEGRGYAHLAPGVGMTTPFGPTVIIRTGPTRELATLNRPGLRGDSGDWVSSGLGGRPVRR